MRILLVTTGCDPTAWSEPLVGYQWASRLSRDHDVTVLNYRRRTERPASEYLPGVRVVEWVEPPGLERVERLNSMARPSYPLFLREARRWLRAAAAGGERFHVGYQPVPVALRYPSPLQGSGLPYVLGPLGGSLPDPAGFETEDTSAWFVRLRRFDGLRIDHDPWLRRTYAEAECVVGIADYVRELLASVPLRAYTSIPDTALEHLPEYVDRRGRSGPVRLLFVGRLVRTKGARDAVRAMSRLRDLDVVLDVVGDGYDRQPCEDLVDELGLRERVTMHGVVDRGDVDGFYERADVFVFPSYREPGGTVTFEALGAGLPMITADRGGPATAVDETCGLTVTPTTPEDYADQIAAAVRALVVDPARRLQLGAGARARTEAIGTWDRKIEAMEHVLISALASAVART